MLVTRRHGVVGWSRRGMQNYHDQQQFDTCVLNGTTRQQRAAIVGGTSFSGFGLVPIEISITFRFVNAYIENQIKLILNQIKLINKSI